jgi:CRISPR-associated exonuclease Cas4
MTPQNAESIWLIAGGILFLGVLIVLIAWRMRSVRGLASGQTLALDNVTLFSSRFQLAGRPDRILRVGKKVIPEEWKSSRRLWPGHIAQMGVYFLLIEERYGVRPPHGYVVLGTGKRHRIDNDAKLRAWVLDLAGQIRTARARVTEPIPVKPRPGQCRSCGQRLECGQARL